MKPNIIKQESNRPTSDVHIQIGYLKAGDIYGLDELRGGIRDSYKLISAGAEIIRLNKRVFLRFASNNTLLKAHTAWKCYPSAKETKVILRQKVEWEVYKQQLLENYALKMVAR